MTRFVATLMSATLVVVCINHVSAQERELPELTPEQRMQRLELNLNAFTIAAIRLAQERGVSPEELGRQYGEIFAPSWGEDLGPIDLLEGMHRNWQMLGMQTRVLAEQREEVRARRTHPYDRETFEQRYGDLGVAYTDVQAFFRSIAETIAETRGLQYTEVDEGDHVVITVRREG